MFIWVLLLAWIGSVVIVVRSFPKAPEVRRRLNALLFMIIPGGLTIFLGPCVIDHHAVGTHIRERMIFGQYAAVVLLCFIAAIGIVRARGARRCALAISVANLIPVFLLVCVSVMILDPGS